MGSLMGTVKNNTNDLGSSIKMTGSLEVSIYPKGDAGATFKPSIESTDTECILSWENDKGMVNPDPINIKGDAGIDGDAATIEVGKVEHSSTASVKNVGTKNAAKFDFGLPGTNLVLNGSEAGLEASIYAPATGGLAGQILSSGGSGESPVWKDEIDAYTKSQVDSNFYKKTQVDTKLNTKQNTLVEGQYVSFEDTATTTTINVLIPKVNTEIDGLMSKEDKSKLDGINMNNYLSKTNTTSYTPTSNYHPATKKYVDDHTPTIEVVDNLTSTDATKPLSANQGRILNNKLSNLSFAVMTKSEYNALATKDPNTFYIIREM